MVRQLGIPASILAVLAVALLATSASAGDFGCGSFVWSSPYPADLTDLYRVGAVRLPPYFALHPPVYYEMPVPRTYGYGPWAYPPYITTPEMAQPVPEIIHNQFVPQPAKATPQKPKTAFAPKLIRNPYVPQPEGLTDATVAVK